MTWLLKNKLFFLGIGFFVLVTFFFFNQFFLKGFIPFPGDLLLSEYNPWRQSAYFGYSPGAIPSKDQSFDVLRQLYPWRKLVIDSLGQGNWPLWDPYNFSGTPLLANFQSAALYPLNLFYFIVGNFNLVWGLQVVVQPLLAAAFTFLLAKQFSQSWPAALLSGLAFGFGSFVIVWLEYNTIAHTVLWLPFCLYFLDRLLVKFNFLTASLFSLGLTFSLLAGHIQNFGFVFVVCLFYFLFKIVLPKSKPVLILPFFVLPFLFGAIQLLPGLELLFNSARSPLERSFLFNQALLSPWQLVFVIVPDFFGNPATKNYFLTDTYIGKVLYIGLLPFILSLVALFNLKDRKEYFFALLGLLFLILAINNPVAGLFFSLPALKNLSPTQSLFIFQFCFALLAGFGLDKLIKQKLNLKNLLPLLTVGLAFLISGLLWFFKPGFLSPAFLENLSVIKRNLGYSILLFLVSSFLYLFLLKLKQRPFKNFLLALVLAFVVFDLFRFFNKITPFVPSDYIFPPNPVFEQLRQHQPWRFWGYGTATLSSNYNAVFGSFSPEGYDPLYPKDYGSLIKLSENGRLEEAARSDAVIVTGFGKTDLIENINRRKILNLLSVGLILDRVENQTDQTTFPPAEFDLIWSQNNWRIYKNKQAFPRAFLAKEIVIIKDGNNFEAVFRDNSFRQPLVILDQPTSVIGSGQGKLEIIDYQAEKVEILVETDEPEMLVLTDTYFPGWQVQVNDETAPLLKANLSLRAVQVPQGKSKVVFEYLPLYFKWGKTISLVSFAGWLILSLFMLISRKAKK